MVLSDRTIRELVGNKRLVISPFDPDQVQPSSYNLRLGDTFRVFKITKKPYLDVRKPIGDFMELIKVGKREAIIVHPGEFLLAETVEYFEFPNDMVGRLEGRSSLGRIGIIVHSMAGYFDPGFKGTATLHISNLANIPVALYPGMKIAQMTFNFLTTPADFPYGSKKLGSKYQGQKGPTESRLFREFVKFAKGITK